jgi:hypothetical protein
MKRQELSELTAEQDWAEPPPPPVGYPSPWYWTEHDREEYWRRNWSIARAYVVERRTLESIGDTFGITRERVRQIASSTVRQMIQG